MNSRQAKLALFFLGLISFYPIGQVLKTPRPMHSLRGTRGTRVHLASKLHGCISFMGVSFLMKERHSMLNQIKGESLLINGLFPALYESSNGNNPPAWQDTHGWKEPCNSPDNCFGGHPCVKMWKPLSQHVLPAPSTSQPNCILLDLSIPGILCLTGGRSLSLGSEERFVYCRGPHCILTWLVRTSADGHKPFYVYPPATVLRYFKSREGFPSLWPVSERKCIHIAGKYKFSVSSLI